MTFSPGRNVTGDDVAPEPSPPAQIVKYSVSLAGHRTSVSLEPKFWELLQASARRRNMSINALVFEIDQSRAGNLSSAVRLYVLDELMRHAEIDSSGTP